jgi:serine O-acetyltransferase
MNSDNQNAACCPPPRSKRWETQEIVSELRALREESLAARHRTGSPVKLPSRKVLASVVEGIGAALFPNRLGEQAIAPESVDYFVGHTLELALQKLDEQIAVELVFAERFTAVPDDNRQKAVEITRHFAAHLPQIRRSLESDIQAAYEGDPAARSADEVLVCYPGLTAVIHYRLANVLHRLGAPLVARIVAEIAHSLTGIDIHPGATIGQSFFIDHGTGVVIGETAVIGDRVRLYQAVTLGAKRFPVDENGALLKGNERHPIVEHDVVIYAGATILGRITIGARSVIGGNVWLTRSVPPDSHISQAKLQNEVFNSGAGI